MEQKSTDFSLRFHFHFYSVCQVVNGQLQTRNGQITWIIGDWLTFIFKQPYAHAIHHRTERTCSIVLSRTFFSCYFELLNESIYRNVKCFIGILKANSFRPFCLPPCDILPLGCPGCFPTFNTVLSAQKLKSQNNIIIINIISYHSFVSLSVL